MLESGGEPMSSSSSKSPEPSGPSASEVVACRADRPSAIGCSCFLLVLSALRRRVLVLARLKKESVKSVTGHIIEKPPDEKKDERIC